MYNEKIEALLIEAGSQIRLKREAYERTLGIFIDLRLGKTLDLDALVREGKIVWDGQPKKTKDRTTFRKEYKKALDEGDHPALDMLMYEIKLIKSGRITLESSMIKDAIKELSPVLSGENGGRLSYDHDTFMRQLHHLTILFVFTRGEIQEINDLALEAIFHAGTVLGRLEEKGRQESDKKGEGKNKPHTGYVSYEEVIKEAEKVSKSVESDRGVARTVHNRLERRERGRDNPRDIYSEDRIRKIWVKHKKGTPIKK